MQKNDSFSMRRSFWVSEYLCIMVAIGLLVTTAVVVALSVAYAKDFLPANLPLNLLWKHDAFQSIALLTGLLLFIYTGTVKEAFQLFGRMIIQDDRLVFKAFFRRSRELTFSQIKHIGIGTAIDGRKWIYFSEVPIPPEKEHNFYKVKMSKQTMYIWYTEEAVKSLKYYLPKNLGRALR